MKKISRQVILSYLPKTVLFLLSPLIIKILTTNLSVEEYGNLSLINSLGNYLFFLAGFGIPRFLAKMVPGQERENQYQLFNSYTIIELTVFLLFFSLIILFHKPLFLWLHLEKFTNYIIVFLLFYVFYILYNELMRFYGLQKKIELKSYLATLEKPIFFLLLIGLILSKSSFTIINVLKSYFILFPALFLIAFLFYRKKYLTDIKINLSLLAGNLLFLFPFFLIDLFYKTKDILPKYLLSGYYSSKTVGLFAFGDNYARLVFILTNSFAFIFYPYIAESYNKFKISGNVQENDKFITYIKTSINFSLYIFTIGFFFAFTFRNFFIKLLGNADYLSIQNKVGFFLLSYFFLTLISVVQPLLILTKSRKILFPIYLTSVILNVGLSFLLVRNFGFFGALLSVLITNFLLLSISLILLKKIIGKLFSFFFFLKYLIFFIILFVLFLGVQYFVLIQFLSIGIAGVGSGILLWFFLKKDIKFMLHTK